MSEHYLCPICNVELKREFDYLDGRILLEQNEECPTGHYVNDYAHGCYSVLIGDKLFQWSYLTDKEEAKEIDEAIERAIAEEREGL